MRVFSVALLSLLLLFNGAFAKGRSSASRSSISRTSRSRSVAPRSKSPKSRAAAAGTDSARRRSSDQHVSGYTRKDGKHVAPYMRSAPNGSQKDNFSTKGNVNPYTGKKGTKPAKR